MDRARCLSVVGVAGLAVAGLFALSAEARQPEGDPLPPRPQQVSPAGPATPRPMGPVARFTPIESRHDFGTILADKAVQHTFRFKNTGEAPLTITSATGSCHCTVPALSKLTYAPGEEGEIPVTFDPRGRAAGQVSQRITVVSNDPASPTTVLTIDANLVPVVNVEPRLIAFNQIPKGESRRVDIVFTGRIPEFAITGATFNGAGPELSAEFTKAEPVEINGERLYRVIGQIISPKDARIERFNREVVFTTNDPREKEIRIPVLGEVLGDVEMRPMRVTMGLVARKAEFSNTATIASRSGKPFRILGVRQLSSTDRPDEPKLSFDVKPVLKDGEKGPAAATHTIAISGSAPDAGFRNLMNVEIITDVPGEEQMSLGVYLVVR